MKVLLIGGTGVLSSAVTSAALESGMSVTMINRGNHRIPDGVELIKSDCENYDYIAERLSDRHFDAVIDFLCYTREQTEKSARLYSRFARQYIFISTTGVIDVRGESVCDENTKKVLPFWDYSVSKWEAEETVRRIFVEKECDCHYTIVRPAITYDNTRIPYGIAPRYGFHWTLVARAKAGKPVITWNDGRNVCNMMRVEEFAQCFVRLIGNAEAFGEAFNICGDEAPSFGDVITCLGKAADVKMTTIDIPSDFFVKFLPQRSGEILARTYDCIHSNKKLKSVVPGFKQEILIGEGVSMTVNAYKSSGYQRGIDWQYDAQMDYVIKRWCKANGISRKKYHLGFVNYLGNASLKARLSYYYVYMQDCLLIKILKKIRG